MWTADMYACFKQGFFLISSSFILL
jgi:hypothetical protein